MALKKNKTEYYLVIIEDEVSALIILEGILKSEGYKLKTFDDSIEAYNFIMENALTIDVIISDINMPKMDGIKLLRKVKEKYKNLEFIITTGVDSLATAVDALKMGAYDYITKPIFAKKISISIEKAIKNKELTEDNIFYQKNLESLVEQRTKELQEANTKLDEAYRGLLQADKLNSLGLMAGTLAHDIASPIQVISSIGKSLLKKHKKTIDPEDIRMFNKCINKITSLIRTVQNYGKTNDHYAKTSVRKMIENTLLLSSKYLSKNNVIVKTAFANKNDVIQCKADEIEQVFTNVIHNAVHALEKNEQEKIIEIKTNLRKTEFKTYMVVSIKDNGCGIPKEILDRIFDSFFTTKSNEKGTGLGLAISRKIIHEHKGDIKIENEPGKGAEFIIELPGL